MPQRIASFGIGMLAGIDAPEAGMASLVCTPDAKRFGALPSAAGILARLACAHVQAAGIDPKPLLDKAGLSRAQIDHRGARLAAQEQIRFVELVAAALNDEFLGFHLARDFDLRKIGLVNYVFGSSDMLGEGLKRAVRYSTIVNEAVSLQYLEIPEVVVGFTYVGVAR